MNLTQVLVQLYNLRLSKAKEAAPFMEAALLLAKCTTQQRKACFLAQVGHESGMLVYTKEIWGPTQQQLKYEPPSKLAKQLGNIAPGSGKRYMGRGWIQTTGESNYIITTREMRKLVPDCPDFHAEPEKLALVQYAALSAAIFWNLKKLNTFADSGDFVTLTKRINGGTNGIAHRQALYTKALILC